MGIFAEKHTVTLPAGFKEILGEKAKEMSYVTGMSMTRTDVLRRLILESFKESGWWKPPERGEDESG